MKQNNGNSLVTKVYFKTELTKSLRKYATKSDLKRATKPLWQQLLKLEERIENLEESTQNRFNDIDKRFDKIDVRFGIVDEQLKSIATTLANIVGKLDDLKIENEIGAHHTKELRDAIENHQKRITKLEQLQHVT